MSSSSASSSMSHASAAAAADRESVWRASGLLPLLLAAVPPNQITVAYHKGRKASEIALGEEVDVHQVSRSPQLDWPLDSSDPNTLWTVACVDVDDPEAAQSGGERRTILVGASTPPMQRIRWLLVNVPAPHMLAHGHVIAEFDMDADELERKRELHRMVLLVFKQHGVVPHHRVPEHTMCVNRIGSLPGFLNRYKEIDRKPYAATFFVVDTRTDAQFGIREEEPEKTLPVEEEEMLPHEEQHAEAHPRDAKLAQQRDAHVSKKVSDVTLGKEHGARGAMPPDEHMRERSFEQPMRIEDMPVGAGNQKLGVGNVAAASGKGTARRA